MGQVEQQAGRDVTVDVQRRRRSMTDFLAASIWMVLSWVIRQVESGGEIDNEAGDEENETGAGGIEEQSMQVIEAEPYEPIEQAIKIGIGVFSVLLLGLCLSAYKKTQLRRIIYAPIAFGLFAVQMFFEYLGDTVKAIESPFNDLILSAMTLAIVALFFIAIVRRQ
jgi:hypothetical protein